MRIPLLRRGARAAAIAALSFATAISGIGTASAASHGKHENHAPEPIQVSLGANGIKAPHDGQGGLVTFHVRTDDAAGRQLQVLRPHAGVSIDKVLDDLRNAINENDPTVSAAGISAVRDDAEALGGAFVTPAVSESFTTPISAGTVYLLDFTAFFQNPSAPVIRTVELCDGPSGTLAEFPDGIVIQHETADGPRFQADNVDLADGSYLVHNESDEIHEMELQPVPAGTTDADIQAQFDAILAGNPPPPNMQQPPAYGLGAISPGHSALLHAEHLPAGTYVLLCFIPDDTSGLPHAFLGMHKVVVLH
jgi:hypothetical protein